MRTFAANNKIWKALGSNNLRGGERKDCSLSSSFFLLFAFSLRRRKNSGTARTYANERCRRGVWHDRRGRPSDPRNDAPRVVLTQEETILRANCRCFFFLHPYHNVSRLRRLIIFSRFVLAIIYSTSSRVLTKRFCLHSDVCVLFVFLTLPLSRFLFTSLIFQPSARSRYSSDLANVTAVRCRAAAGIGAAREAESISGRVRSRANCTLDRARAHRRG